MRAGGCGTQVGLEARDGDLSLLEIRTECSEKGSDAIEAALGFSGEPTPLASQLPRRVRGRPGAFGGPVSGLGFLLIGELCPRSERAIKDDNEAIWGGALALALRYRAEVGGAHSVAEFAVWFGPVHLPSPSPPSRSLVCKALSAP